MIQEKIAALDAALAACEADPRQSLIAHEVLTQLDRYFRAIAAASAPDKKGKELAEPLDASIRVAVSLFEGIDTGSSGVDEKLAGDLREVYEKYLGTFRQ